MAKQSLMWTALPNGVDKTGALRISALISPRLEPDADQILKPFTDMTDWPNTLSGAIFTISFGPDSVKIPGNETAAAARVDGTIDLPDSDAWTRLIHADTFVRAHDFEDLSNNVVLSYDTMAMNALARQLYGSLGSATSDQLPKVSRFLEDPGWQDVINSVEHIDRIFTQEKKGGLRDTAKQFDYYRKNRLETLSNPKAGLSTAGLLARAQLFHTPPSTPEAQDYSGAAISADDPRKNTTATRWRTYRRTALPGKADFENLIDFHQIVAAMNQYPRLLRRLGIVVDFIVPKGAFAATPDSLLTVTCALGTPDPPGVLRAQASPGTHAMLSASKFAPVPRPSWNAGDYLVRDGLLAINPDLYGVLQTDVDAAGLKIMNFARTLSRMAANDDQQRDPVTKFEKEAGAPALRNAGLMLVQRRRGLMLENAFASNKTKNDSLEQALATGDNSKAPPLYTEDLIRGWRIDIWDGKTQKWRSLCQRKSEHVIDETLHIEDDHEGMVRLAATKSADETSNPDIVYLHEALVSWTGWSLVAPQPGRAIDKKDSVGAADVEVPPGLRLKSSFTARQGSLPRLRYGRKYWIRARMVDLAGNSLPSREKDYGPEHEDQYAVQYFRFEPVQAPAIALVREGGNYEKPAEGESMERIAIRTFNAVPADNAVPAIQIARRFVVPARTTVKEAELHGMLDGAGDVNGSTGMFNLLAAKDSPLEGKELVTQGALADPLALPVGTTYAVLDSGSTEIPYLPDPLCVTISARIIDHPTFPGTTIIPIPAYRSGDRWPMAAPFKIRVYEDPGASPKFDETERVLLVPLPKAIRATLRLSCQLSHKALDLMGVWEWIKDMGGASLEPKAREGQHWMLTPWRNVELVHAVQKPLITPEMAFRLDRRFGETRALPVFTATCSLNSTARVDLQAEWHEPDEDPEAAAKGADRTKSDHVYSVKITDPKSYAMKKYDPKATGIPEHDIIGPDLISVGAVPRETILKYHEFGDTRYRRVKYRLEATTRFREYMPQAILTKDDGAGNRAETDENIKVTGPEVVAWAPNSAPPPAPEVLYVVPTFGWTASKGGSSETRWRRGGGLRIYLNRPWNASGYGEMLAVVLPRAGFAGDPNVEPAQKPYKKFVTQWGNDPIWVSPFVDGPCPTAANFPLRRTGPDTTGKWLPDFAPLEEALQSPHPFNMFNLTHPGLGFSQSDPSVLVDVAPHDVAYDADRHLWYCDVEVNFAAAYYPFIRLALARYQPTSVPGAHLSNIVLADFMPLAPDRWLTVTAGSSPKSRSVSVYGHTYRDSAGNVESRSAQSVKSPELLITPVKVRPSSTIEVWVERLNPGLGEDFGWIPEPNAVIAHAAAVSKPTKAGPAQAVHLAQMLRERAYDTAVETGVLRPWFLWPLLWNGTVTLPKVPSGQTRFRLVVAEYEEYIVDGAAPFAKIPLAKDRRLVFVEHVELT
jgi:hypothetical protein